MNNCSYKIDKGFCFEPTNWKTMAKEIYMTITILEYIWTNQNIQNPINNESRQRMTFKRKD